MRTSCAVTCIATETGTKVMKLQRSPLWKHYCLFSYVLHASDDLHPPAYKLLHNRVYTRTTSCRGWTHAWESFLCLAHVFVSNQKGISVLSMSCPWQRHIVVTHNIWIVPATQHLPSPAQILYMQACNKWKHSMIDRWQDTCNLVHAYKCIMKPSIEVEMYSIVLKDSAFHYHDNGWSNSYDSR